jgi:hypothetical protein
MKKTHPPNYKITDEEKRHINQIHLLAKRLPWIVVATVTLAAIIIIIQAFLGLT